MNDKKLKILSNIEIAPEIFKITFQVEKDLDISAGQFINIEVPGKDLILKRPICIYDYDKKTGEMSASYQIAGEGTRRLSKVLNGELLSVTYPLGNSFPKTFKNVAICGGGVGVFPLQLLKNMEDVNFDAYLGFKNKDYSILKCDFEKFCKEVSVATDDGSFGTKGFVTNLLENSGKRYDAVFACGPKPMLKSLKKVCDKLDLKLYASLEERMGCGVGACLVCACKVLSKDGFTYKRVCADGAVFDMSEVILDD